MYYDDDLSPLRDDSRLIKTFLSRICKPGVQTFSTSLTFKALN